MPLGLERGTVRLVPYDARWPALFAEEKARLEERLARAGLVLALEHTGSTSIPGLAAKPIIDILAGRPPEGPPVAEYVRVLVAAGYQHRGEQGIPGREFFRRGEPRSWHLHLAVRDGSFWRDHVTFRDRLRASDALRDEYARLKLDLARRFPFDRERYIEEKGPFVRGVLGGGVRGA